MRNTLAFTVLVGLVGVFAVTRTAAQQPEVRPATASTATIEEVLTAVRSDLQSERSDIIAKNVTLTSEQAAKFWPIFNAYQKEQDAIMDEQLKGIQRYAASADQLDDAGALALINAHIARDARMSQLRGKWLAEFQKALGGKLAARVMQIDRRLSLAHQVVFSASIPLIH